MAGSSNAVTAIVLTHNEAVHIERCVASLLSAGMRVCIVDSFSQDDTVAKASSLGAEVKQNAWVNYATQFKWGLENFAIESTWVLRIDADEYLSDALKAELPRRLEEAPPEATGFTVRLDYIFLDGHIRRGGFQALKLLRIWRHGCGDIEQRWMDEHITLRHGRVEHLSGRLVHHDLRPITFWLAKHNGYATREMVDYMLARQDRSTDKRIAESGRRNPAGLRRRAKEDVYNRLPLFLRPCLMFLYRYIVQLGILDGRAGFVYLVLQCLMYRMIVDCKIYEARRHVRDNGFASFPDYVAEAHGLKL